MGPQRLWRGFTLRCHRSGRCLFIFVLLVLPLSATTYYVDNCVTVGNDSNNGTSSATPWLTLGHLTGLPFNPGDTINLRGGCSWREELSLNHAQAAGARGNPITVQSYGTGQAIINGSNLLNSGWRNASGNTWQVALTTQPTWVFFNNTLGTAVGSIGAITAAHDWYWAGNILYVYSTSNPAAAFTSPGVEVPVRKGVTHAINGYVVFNNLGVQKVEGYGFNLYQVPNSVVSNSTVSYSTERGISFYGGACSGFAMFGNTISYTGGDAIGIGGCGTGGAIYNNDVSHCGLILDDRSCVSLSGTPVQGVDIYNNVIHDSTEQTGSVGIRCIILDTIGSGSANYVHNNKVYNCNGHGIEVLLTDNQQIYNNVVYGNHSVGNAYTDGIVASTGSGNLIYNNTIYDNTYYCLYITNAPSTIAKNNICLMKGGSQGGIFVDTTTSGLALDYNLVYGWGSEPYRIMGTTYTAPPAYYAATRFGQHDLTSDPKLNSPTTGDFTLQSSSPAIDAGANLGSTYQLGLMPGSSWPSTVSTVNQNVAGAGWEIGAFVFVQQINQAPPAPPTGLSATVN